jgi:tripartite-type tricarboxylate transporter receptor subunit TctC
MSLLIACTLLGPLVARGQAFPSKVVRIITADPGGGNELAARLIAAELGKTFGQQVIVESRGGASGALAAQAVSRAPPDGHTLLLYSSGLWVTPLLRDVPWDTLRDFAPVALLAQAPNVLVVHPVLPVRRVRDLATLARARPGELNYSSGGSGAAAHLAAELFKSMTKSNIVRVRYKGTGAGLIALVGGEVQMMFPAAGSVAGYVASNKLRALALTSAKRSALAPELPTMAESGLAGYEAVSTYALFAPAKTPAGVIDRIGEATLAALASPDLKQRFMLAGVETIGAPAEQLERTIRSDIGKWGSLIKAAGIRDD